MIRNEDEGGQAEVIWTCYEERLGVHRKKDDGNGVAGKEEKREAKKKIFRCSEGRYGKIGVREKDIQNRTLWRNMIHCCYP